MLVRISIAFSIVFVIAYIAWVTWHSNGNFQYKCLSTAIWWSRWSSQVHYVLISSLYYGRPA